MTDLIRYSLIKTKMPREFLLLKGTGCRYKKCAFCDYYLDASTNPFEKNKEVLNKVTGETGVLDIINSGSAMELDSQTLNLIYEKAKELKIHTIWFEAHWMYRNQLNDFKNKFPGIKIKFRIGIETFNPLLRTAWHKGIPASTSPQEIAKYFQGGCLLVGVKGQTKETIQSDIQTALSIFEYFSVNVFIKNSTDIEPDPLLITWFKKEMVPLIEENPKIEILLNNTDLGVG